MNILSIAPAIMAGVAILVGVYHGLIYSRIKSQRYNLTFTLMCLLVGAYDFFCAGLYLSNSIAEGIWWSRAQIVSLLCFAITFLWFLIDYTHAKGRKIPYLFTAYFIVQIILSILNPDNILQNPEIPNIKHFEFEFGLGITYYEAAAGILSTIHTIHTFFGFLYAIYLIMRFSHSGHRAEARPLFGVMVIYFIGAINDSLIVIDVYQFIYLIEYSYIAIVVYMTYTISKTVVDAAVLEQALRESEARYRHIVEGMSDGLLVVDENGKITYVNDPLCKMLDYKREEILGHPIKDYLHEEEMNSLYNQQIQLGKGNQGLFEIDWNGFGGRIIHTLSAGAFFYDNNQKFTGGIVVITDITERKRAEETLKKLYEETLKISEMKSNLITFVSHELKTPLVPIMGWSQFMQKVIDEGLDLNKIVEKEGLEGIVRSSTRLSNIINNFLDLDRLERGRLELKREPWPVTTLLENSLKELRELKQSKRITIKNNCANINLNVDGFRIEQALINILNNALKYSPPGGLIEITSERSDTQFIIYFKDNGYGFTPEELQDIWQPFTTAYLRKKDQSSSGTGIGLHLTKGIIEQHGGQIEISSQGINQGTIVKITIPLDK